LTWVLMCMTCIGNASMYLLVLIGVMMDESRSQVWSGASHMYCVVKLTTAAWM